ncbi:hypothetical protein JXA47_16755, partial [Candidatus Sumerlaeota bacterium]|nr:hypothetical protein [Candidatus Sumerlaeota bacterium]
ATDSGFIPLSERFQASSTFFEGVGANQFHVGDLDSDGQPEVLIARGGLIRVLSFSETPEIRVVAQITAPLPGAELVAVSAAPAGDDHPALICAVDRSDATVLVCTETEAGAWEITSEVDLQIPSSQRLMLGDWDGDEVLDLAVKASQAVTVLFGGVTSSPLAQLATCASPLDDGRFGLLETMTWDGGETWAHLIDHRYHTLLIQRWDAEAEEWAEVYRFPVFETPGERRRDWDRDLEAINVQPREMAVADINGDGLDDLVLLAHDHLLIYPRREVSEP